MKQKRWLVFLWIAVSIALLAASILFKWQRGINLAEDRFFPTFAREHWGGLSTPVANLSGLLSFFLISLVFYFLMPRTMRSIGKALKKKGDGLRAASLGLLAALLVFFTILSAALSNSTFPFALIVAGLVLFAGMTGMVALELRLGAWLASMAGWKNTTPVVHLLLAVIALYPFCILPSIGSLVMVVYTLLGLGTVLLTRVNALYPWNHESLNSEENRLEGN
jgi:hypothetical protein